MPILSLIYPCDLLTTAADAAVNYYMKLSPF